MLTLQLYNALKEYCNCLTVWNKTLPKKYQSKVENFIQTRPSAYYLTLCVNWEDQLTMYVETLPKKHQKSFKVLVRDVVARHCPPFSDNFAYVYKCAPRSYSGRWFPYD